MHKCFRMGKRPGRRGMNVSYKPHFVCCIYNQQNNEFLKTTTPKRVNKSCKIFEQLNSPSPVVSTAFVLELSCDTWEVPTSEGFSLSFWLHCPSVCVSESSVAPTCSNTRRRTTHREGREDPQWPYNRWQVPHISRNHLVATTFLEWTKNRLQPFWSPTWCYIDLY